MSKNKKQRQKQARAQPKGKGLVGLCNVENYDSLTCSGYTTLAQSPEVSAAVDRIADLVGSMTIHLMENTDNGDIRIKNELAKKIDINPYRYTTRTQFMHWIIKTLLLEGNGNAIVYPQTEGGILKDLIPIPSALVSLSPYGQWGYQVYINGRAYDPEEVLHFVVNPDSYYPWRGNGYRTTLAAVANNLKQAATTERGFMQSKWKPSVIVKVDGLTEEFSSPSGRKRLLDDYVTSAEAGEPWLIPSDQFSVEQIKPLSLSDLALAEFVELDKKTVASILGVPPFVLGVGEFKRETWNNFISSKIMPLAKAIEQEMTKKILVSSKWFFRFNSRSLFNYDLKDLAAIADDQYTRGIMTGNEVRDWLGLSPKEGLNDLIILENYIPRGMIGEQNKLKQGGEQ